MNAPYPCRCAEPTPDAAGCAIPPSEPQALAASCSETQLTLAARENTLCAKCGGERKPVVVWREDVSERDRTPPRTDPPRHAEAAALELYKRVAAHSPPRVRKRFHARGIITGLALLGFAGVVYYFDWDQSLLRLISIALGLVGMITLLKGLLGHGRGS